MTNLQAIQEDLRPYPVRRSLIERKCAKYGLDAGSDLLSSNEKTITRIVIEVLGQMISLNNVSESGVAISFDKGSVETRIRSLCSEIGLDSSNYVNESIVRILE